VVVLLLATSIVAFALGIAAAIDEAMDYR